MTQSLVELLKHYGPGPHPSGSSQSIHGGDEEYDEEFGDEFPHMDAVKEAILAGGNEETRRIQKETVARLRQKFLGGDVTVFRSGTLRPDEIQSVSLYEGTAVSHQTGSRAEATYVVAPHLVLAWDEVVGEEADVGEGELLVWGRDLKPVREGFYHKHYGPGPHPGTNTTQEIHGQKTRRVWHLTDNPKFALDPKFKAQQNYLAIAYNDDPGLYVTKYPEHWVNGYDYVRPFIVELEVTEPERGAGVPGGNQDFIPATVFERVRIVRVIPTNEWVREEYGEKGWMEEWDSDEEPSETIAPFGHDYHYTGPDVRDMPAAEVARLKDQTMRYLQAVRPWVLEDDEEEEVEKSAPRGLGLGFAPLAKNYQSASLGLMTTVLTKHYGPGPHPSGSSQDAHSGHTLSPLTGPLHGVPNMMSTLPDKITAKIRSLAEEHLGSDSEILDRFRDLLKTAADQSDSGVDWYHDVHAWLETKASEADLPIEDVAAGAAAISPGVPWATKTGNDNQTMLASLIGYVTDDPPLGSTVDMVELKLDADAAKNGTPKPPDLTADSHFSDIDDPRYAALAWYEMEKAKSPRGVGPSIGSSYTGFASAISVLRGDIEAEEALTGPKTRSFFNNMLLIPTDDVTIDVQMLGAARGKGFTRQGADAVLQTKLVGTPSMQRIGVGDVKVGVIPLISDHVRTLTAELNAPGSDDPWQNNLKPYQVQAIIWTEFKRRFGRWGTDR